MKNDVSLKVFDYEMVHWNEPDLFIAHKANKITYIRDGVKKIISIPTSSIGWKKFFMPLRKLRRLLRIDKTMILPSLTGLVAIRGGTIYTYQDKENKWDASGVKLNCRNPMYNAFLNLEGVLYVGEYGNPNGIGKRILMSKDNGKTWKIVHQFASDEIRHIHALEWDPYDEKIWIFTGDFTPEPQVFKADKDFQTVIRLGGGSQQWRACHAIFSEDAVHWIMDSPDEEVHHIRFDRNTGKISIGQVFKGPIWFARRYGDYVYATTTQEIGQSHKDKYIHMYRTKDMRYWEEIYTFKHDGWPKRYFRFGTITSVRGSTPMFSCEGVKGLDGKTFSIMS